jgi:hypothetical protein
MDRNIFKSRSVGAHLTAGAENIVYTCPNNYTSHIELLFAANLGSGNKTLTIKWYDATTDTDYYIIGGYVISSYNFLKLDGSYLTLNAGDHISFTPEAGSTMDATITVEEFYDPTSNQ